MILECLLASFISDSGKHAKPSDCRYCGDACVSTWSGVQRGARAVHISHEVVLHKQRRSCTVWVEERQAETKYVHVLYVLHTSYLLLTSSVFFIYPACPSQRSFSSARVWFFIDTVEM
jgi:hypothetical protein